MRLQEDTYMPKPGATSLMKAAVQETPAEIVALLKAGADINAEDSSGWTAQMYAAQAGKLESLKFLPTAGAKAGQSPLQSRGDSYLCSSLILVRSLQRK